MKPGRRAIIYGAIGLTALFVVLVVAVSLSLSSGSNGFQPSADRSEPPSAATGNHSASNASALGGPQGGSSDTAGYPTLASDKPLVQSVHGYTVTLYLMYADANRIALKYRVDSAYDDLSKISTCQTLHGQDPPCYVTGPVLSPATPLPDPTREAYEPRLTTSDGQSLPWARYSAEQPLDNMIGSMITFDTKLPPENLPRELKLHLVLNEAEFGVAHTLHDIKGPFAFDFSVSIDPLRRIGDIGQTATTAQGDTITIEKVIATPHDVRVIWSANAAAQPQGTPMPGLSAPGSYACCNMQLTAGDKSGLFRANPWSSAQRDDTESIQAIDEQGGWTISTSYVSTWMGDMSYPDIPGPVFRFTLPPAITTLQP